MIRAAGLRRFCGITLFGNGSRKICGFVRLIGLAGSYSGFGRELKGLKMLTPASLKSPKASASVGTVPMEVIAFTLRRPS